jgi:hypothetical protein
VTTHMEGMRHALAAVLVVIATIGTAAAQDALDGGWELVAYDSTASVGKASGLLTFAAGRFSLVYTMEEPDGRTSGRAHAGRFEHRAGALTLHVEWNVEHVSGKGRANRGPAPRTVRTTLAGDVLTLTFENGSIQRFRRVAPVK